MIHTNISINERGSLAFAGVDVASLAEQYGTPLYLLDEDRIRANCRMYLDSIRESFGEGSAAAYASKALCIKALFPILQDEGMCADVVSGGELYTALKAGFSAERIFFHGNNKALWELELALDSGVGMILIDNERELNTLAALASARGVRVKAMLRLTPGIDPHTFNSVNTGRIDCQFGVPIETGQAMELVLKALDTPNIDILGMHCHIGSQIFGHAPYILSAQKMIAFLAEVREKTGYEPEYLNLGGGYPVRYVDSDPAIDIPGRIAAVGRLLDEECRLRGVKKPKIILEPGRSIVADAGMTIYRAGAIKTILNHKTYAIIDGGMTDDPRYALYGAKYTVYNAGRMREPADAIYTIAGRCCESGDIIQENVKLPRVESGDLIAVAVTGAYNYSMASNYNRVPRPPIVILNGGTHRLAVRRETLDDLIHNDL